MRNTESSAAERSSHNAPSGRSLQTGRSFDDYWVWFVGTCEEYMGVLLIGGCKEGDVVGVHVNVFVSDSVEQGEHQLFSFQARALMMRISPPRTAR